MTTKDELENKSKKKKKLRKEFGPREHAYARTLRSKPQNLCLRSPKST